MPVLDQPADEAAGCVGSRRRGIRPVCDHISVLDFDAAAIAQRPRAISSTRALALSHPFEVDRRPLIEQAEALREETEQLKEALERRPVIDVARGVLMASWSCSQEDAWQILLRVSQHTNTKLHDVADAVVATTRQRPMPAEWQEQLAAAVAAWRADETRNH
ncbi:ANTAR domain-containing protein [Streptomyces sp. NPDC051172]|uniref:ANTAR domain-containing protein n=1 Tax=Streptomyces sp. NPDC051172 TaxID=3155796 RepID=UPI00343E0231